eukprot:gene16865-23134_t
MKVGSCSGIIRKPVLQGDQGGRILETAAPLPTHDDAPDNNSRGAFGHTRKIERLNRSAVEKPAQHGVSGKTLKPSPSTPRA